MKELGWSGEDKSYTFFNLADEHTERYSGWDRLTVYADRYQRSNCLGGPPSYKDVFEYNVSGKKVYQRLVSSEIDDFFKTTDEHPLCVVDNGAVIEDSLKILDAEDALIGVKSDNREGIKFQLCWHEVPDTVVQYALWATVNFKQRNMLIAEAARLNAAFAAVDEAAKKLGGSCKKDGLWYAEPTTDELRNLQSAGLAEYGITRDEMFEQDKILKVLSQAIEQSAVAEKQ